MRAREGSERSEAELAIRLAVAAPFSAGQVSLTKRVAAEGVKTYEEKYKKELRAAQLPQWDRSAASATAQMRRATSAA